MNHSERLYRAWSEAQKSLSYGSEKDVNARFVHLHTLLNSLGEDDLLDSVLSNLVEKFDEYIESDNVIESLDMDDGDDPFDVFLEDISSRLSIRVSQVHKNNHGRQHQGVCTEIFVVPFVGTEKTIQSVFSSGHLEILCRQSEMFPRTAKISISGAVSLSSIAQIILQPQDIFNLTKLHQNCFLDDVVPSREELGDLEVIDQVSDTKLRMISGVFIGSFSYFPSDEPGVEPFNFSVDEEKYQKSQECIDQWLNEQSSDDIHSACIISPPSPLKFGIATVLSDYLMTNLEMQAGMEDLSRPVIKFVWCVPSGDVDEEKDISIMSYNDHGKVVGTISIGALTVRPYLDDIMALWSAHYGEDAEIHIEISDNPCVLQKKIMH